MPTVVVRDVPEDVYVKLTELASAAGRSLEDYLFVELARLATKSAMAEVVDRIEARGPGRVGFRQSVEDLDAERR
jgi:hypothetical protein